MRASFRLLEFVALPFDSQRMFTVHRFPFSAVLCVLAICCLLPLASQSKEPASGGSGSPQAAGKKFGIQKRVPWTTSRVQGSPEPPDPYRVKVAYKNLSFSQPLAIERIPGSNKFVVVERLGKLFLFENKPDAKAELLLDVGRTVYGVAFHPQFDENGFLYVTSILDPALPSAKGSRLSRFKLKTREPLRADPDSEEVLLEWPSGGHNGGNIQFGPDGYLYLVTGDGSGIADRARRQ